MNRRNAALAIVALGAVAVAALAAALAGPSPEAVTASSHREAPLISEDPSADNTDLYAFRSPDKPSTVTIVANWIPGEDPAAGPNYYTFSPSAKYKLNIDRTGDARPDIVYEFRFGRTAGPAFLGNTVQSWSMWRNKKLFARGKTPPNNIGPRSTPNYPSLVSKSIVRKGGLSIFAGQRDDAFFGDIGAIFDLLAFRKGTGANGGGKDFFAGYGVHAIAVQIPIAELKAKNSTIGVWASTERQNVTVAGKLRRGWTQVSRIGNPLVNEVVVPTAVKDQWNRSAPVNDKQYAGPGADADPGEADERPLQGERPGDEPRRPRRRVRHRRQGPQLHRRHRRRHAAAQLLDPGDAAGQDQPPRGHRRRQRRLPERPPAR